jgi:formylglycine-generating enzyme required for sulfatase activity
MKQNVLVAGIIILLIMPSVQAQEAGYLPDMGGLSGVIFAAIVFIITILIINQYRKKQRIEKMKREILFKIEEATAAGSAGKIRKREMHITTGVSSNRVLIAFAAVFLIFVIGYWAILPDSSENPETELSQTPVSTATLIQVPSATPAVLPTPVFTPSLDAKTITNSIGMEFVLMPAGEFDMGSPSNEKDRYSNEGPLHRVKISNAFYMGKYEVTQKQWRDVMGSSPSYFKGDDLPVERVSWNDVQDFIKKLNEKEGSNKYRLPSEAEWEYAARAGTATRYSFGDDESKLGDYAWYYANSGSKTHEVGTKKLNPWGLYDMHGNVWEWVQDKWHGDYSGAATDGSAWERSGSDRVVRGGGWSSLARDCRSADRNNDGPGDRDGVLGFRLLRVL